MQSSAIILLVTVCVVNASVININFYGVNHDDSESVDDCNFQACDQLCRNLGFPGGACVGDRCDCDNFKPHSYTKKVTVPFNDCSVQACHQLCLNLGYPSGACAGDRCVCDNIQPHFDSCNSQVCDQLCRWMGYPKGTCVDDKCNCLEFLRSSNENHDASHSSKNDAVSHIVEECNFQACDQLCRRLGFPSGACVGNKCECDNFQHVGNRQKSLVRKLFTCDTIICDEMCHRLNFAGGMCEDGNCQCTEAISL